MRVDNSFSVEAPLQRVWTHLLDVPAVAPCVPGAELTEVISETEYRGTIKVKLGAAQLSYRGTLLLKEVDVEARRIVLSAKGSETKGSGGASGTVTSVLAEDGPGRTTVTMTSEIAVSGKVAQLGRNIIQDVSNKLIKDFAHCLEANLQSHGGERTETAPPASPGPSGAQAATAAGGEGAPTAESSPASHDHPAGGAGETKAAELKVLPLVADVAKARLARGLRRVARVLDPGDKG